MPSIQVDTSSIEGFEGMTVISEYMELNISDETHPIKKYALSHDLYPSEYIHSDSTYNLIDQFLNSTQNEYLGDEQYELLASSESILNDYYGKEFRWKNLVANEYFKTRVFLVESSVYQLSVFSRQENSHNKAINEFLDSFQLSEKLRGNYNFNFENYIQSYSISFPTQPVLQTRTLDSELGKLVLVINILETTNDPHNLLYMACEVEHPPNAINSSSNYELNNFFISSINGSVNAANGQLISIKDIEYIGSPGKEYKMYAAEGQFIAKYRLFYINDVLYSFGVMTQSINDDNSTMESFLNSFKIVE